MNYNIIFIIFIFLLTSCNESEKIKEEQKPTQVNPENIATQSLKVRDYNIQPDDMVMGDSQSSVVLVEYFSPTCPHCVHYHKSIFPELKKNYIDTNKIAYVFREFIGNKQDLDASILARCKGDLDSYLKFMDVILSTQEKWAFGKNYREVLTNIAGLGGVSAETFIDCLNNQDKMKTLLDNTKLITSEPKFVGTPSFFINGKQYTGIYTLEELSKVIDKEIGSVKK